MDDRGAARDEDIGLTRFLTSTPGVGGRLKTRVEDFQVDEVGGLPPETAAGRFACAVVRLENWETNRFVNVASERLQISRKKVRFSGTKDKRGITTRVFTFEAPLDRVQTLASLPGVTIERSYLTDRESELGDHVANEFTIRLRALEPSRPELEMRIGEVARAADEAGGFPNAFGPQRFGALRATTHLVGFAILRGEFLAAAHAYLQHAPTGLELQDAQQWTKRLAARDYVGLQALTNTGQSFERAILHRLHEKPDDPLYALGALPKNLQLLFVAAAQSFLFNQILSRRMAQGLPLAEAVEGDLVAPIERGELRTEWVPVVTGNRARVNAEIRRGRAAVTGWLPGTEAPSAAVVPGQIEVQVLAHAGLTRSNFIVPERLEWSSKGTRRALHVRPEGLVFHVDEDDLHPGRRRANFRFSLPRGAYATSVLREFMKSPTLDAYA